MANVADTDSSVNVNTSQVSETKKVWGYTLQVCEEIVA